MKRIQSSGFDYYWGLAKEYGEGVVTKEDVLGAIEEVNQEGVPARRVSRKTFILHIMWY